MTETEEARERFRQRLELHRRRAATYDQQRAFALLARFCDRFPPDVLEDMESLVVAGEEGIVLESFCGQLYEYDVALEPEELTEIAELGKWIGLNPEDWQLLSTPPPRPNLPPRPSRPLAHVFGFVPRPVEQSVSSSRKGEESAAIRQIVDAELARRRGFVNSHGITVDNVQSYRVVPFQVPVDPDDLETQVRPMWVVLQESHDPTEGHVVVYDPVGRWHWGVAEHVRDGAYVLVTAAASLSEALGGM